MSAAFRTTLALVLIALSLSLAAEPAYAHERRVVGKYTLIVGWHEEPTLQELPNAVFLRVFETATNRPVEGLDKTVTVSVRAGGAAPHAPTLRPLSGQPGQYVGPLIPSRAGDYVFQFRGKVEELELNEIFESGPGRFDLVRSAADLTYPDAAASRAELTRELAALRADQQLDRALVVVALLLGAGAAAVSFRRGRRIIGAALVAAVLTGLAASAPAVAAPAPHAFFASADPAPNARLATPPQRISIMFTGDLDATRSAIALLRTDGSAVPLPAAQAGGTVRELAVTVGTPLTPGVYAVRWKSVDAHDGDVQEGYFAFAVGADTPVALRGLPLTGTGEGISAQLDITPGRLGENAYRVHTSAGGAAFVPERVTLRFTPTALGVTSAPVALAAAADAFTGTGMELAIAGAYTVTAAIRRAGAGADTPVTFSLTAPAQQAATPSPSPARTPSPSPVSTPAPTASAAPAGAPVQTGAAVPLLVLLATLAALGGMAVVALRRRKV